MNCEILPPDTEGATYPGYPQPSPFPNLIYLEGLYCLDQLVDDG